MKYSLIIISIVALLLIQNTNASITQKGPTTAGKMKVLLHLNDASGNPVDSSGNSISPAVKGTATYSQPGIFGTGIKLPGRANALIFRDRPAANTTIWGNYNGQMSFSIWLNPAYTTLNSPKGSNSFFSRYSTGRYFTYATILNSTGKLYWAMCNSIVCNAAINGFSTTVIPANAWTHVALVYSNNTTPNLRVYINGVLENSSIGAFSPSAQNPSNGGLMNTTIGGFYNENGIQGWNGTIDEAILYTNYSLTATEILNLYESGITQLNITTPVNNSVFAAGVAFSVNTSVGYNGGLVNVSFTHFNSSVDVLGRSLNSSSVKIYNVDSYHDLVSASYSNIPAGSYSVGVSACGGSSSALKTCDSGSVSFTVGTTTTTTTTTITTTTTTTSIPFHSDDSVISSTQGGLELIPYVNRLYLVVYNFTMFRPDGQLVCCGPSNSNVWACVSGAC